MAKIYVASSWRNVFQQDVVAILRDLGHEVYDFKNPPHGNGGFQWSDIDPDWQNWTTEQYQEALNHPIAQKGFDSDFNGMQWADVCVMVLPCGRSANTVQSPNQKIPDRKTKCVIKTHINIKQNVIFSAKLKPV